jgi:hypothetical protein
MPSKSKSPIEDLSRKVALFIQEGKETEQVDFKREWHSENERLLHDILCFANTIHNHDCYIIIGVDDDGTVFGVEKDLNRKKQVEILDLLSNTSFAGDNAPQIAVDTIHVDGKEIDVLTIFNSFDVPFFLRRKVKNYTILKEEYIYIRNGDKNTATNRNATYREIEALWKKRFLLLLPPLEQIRNRLENALEWTEGEGGYFNNYKPEFQIILDYPEEERTFTGEYYVFSQTNPSYRYGELKILFNQTILKNFQFVTLDGGRYKTTTPTWDFIYDSDKSDLWNSKLGYKYFLKDSLDYQLQQFLYDPSDSEEMIAKKRFDKVVLYFLNNEERLTFNAYVLENQVIIERLIENAENQYFSVESDNELYRIGCLKNLRTGFALNQMLILFRKQ